MYPGPNVPRHWNSRTPIARGYLWVIILKNPKVEHQLNTMVVQVRERGTRVLVRPLMESLTAKRLKRILATPLEIRA